MTVAVDPVELPEYRDLYYEWERGQWEAGTIDLTDDRRQWPELTPDERDSFLWWLSVFYAGEAGVTDALVPFVDAAPTEEQGVILTTQLVDQARQTVFFDRLYAEALEVPGADLERRIERQADRLDPTHARLLYDELPAVAARIRDDGYRVGALVEGVVLFHLLIEGTLGLTAQRFLLDHAKAGDILPGFREGLTAVGRDTARHVDFGTRFLKEAAELDPIHRDTIRSVVDRSLGAIVGLFEPTGAGAAHFEPLSFDPEAMSAAAVGSVRSRLKVIGIDLPG